MGKESRDPEAERDSVEASVFEDHATMSETTGIQWTDATWNPWHGCHKISPGCKFCYMFSDKARYGQDANVVQRSKTKFKDPLKWPKAPRMCFTCSWSDWFIEEADAWRDEAYEIIRSTPWITYQILTKRIERAVGRVPVPFLPNVWLGVSVENQDAADLRIPVLMRTPAAKRFISYEPALGPVDFERGGFSLLRAQSSPAGVEYSKIDWLIVGGESGNSARPFDITWARKAIADCRLSNVAVFVKQLGDNPFVNDEAHTISVNLKASKGGEMSEWDDDLRVREFPG